MRRDSPTKRAGEITTPLFLAHGSLDQRVHIDHYTKMKASMKKRPSKTTFMRFKGEDHFLSNQTNCQNFFKGLDKFLDEHIGVLETAN